MRSAKPVRRFSENDPFVFTIFNEGMAGFFIKVLFQNFALNIYKNKVKFVAKIFYFKVNSTTKLPFYRMNFAHFLGKVC